MRKRILRNGGTLLLALFIFLPLPMALAVDENPKAWQAYFEAQLKILENKIIGNSEILQAVSQANKKNAHLTYDEILKIDRQWQQTEGVDLFIVSLITNELADKLKVLQKKQRGFVEILMTDQRGLLIAATNKTSDFYQADEAWWQRAFQLNAVNGFIGQIEYDKSALVEVLPFYLVIRDEHKAVRAVVKAVFSRNSILRREL